MEYIFGTKASIDGIENLSNWLPCPPLGCAANVLPGQICVANGLPWQKALKGLEFLLESAIGLE